VQATTCSYDDCVSGGNARGWGSSEASNSLAVLKADKRAIFTAASKAGEAVAFLRQ
jgi:antirestriction protein ArdC